MRQRIIKFGMTFTQFKFNWTEKWIHKYPYTYIDIVKIDLTDNLIMSRDFFLGNKCPENLEIVMMNKTYLGKNE